MAMGQLLRQARLEAGLSQRQLCGEEITRNMLSQIENGAANPSVETLCYLAGRLGKPVSWFLGEDTASPNQKLLEQANAAYASGDYASVLELLEGYIAPDPVFDDLKELLQQLSLLARAEQVLAEGKTIYAQDLLQQAAQIQPSYCTQQLNRQQLLLLAAAQPEQAGSAVAALPSLDEELLLRAKVCMQQGDAQRCLAYLGVLEDQSGDTYLLLAGQAYAAVGEYAQAIAHYQKAEQPPLKQLEYCYEQLGDYKMAYHYAKMQQ